MSSSIEVEKYLHDMVNKIVDPDIANEFQQLEGFYINKLWNQLSDLATRLVNNEQFVKAVDLDEYYQNFVREFEHRIQPLQLIELIFPIAEHKFKTNRASAFEFLKKFEKTVENNPKALVRLMANEIELLLKDKEAGASQCNDMNLVREMLEETEKKLDQLVEVGPVHAAFYKVSAAYQRQVGDYARYYTEALRYLGCEDLDKLTAEEKREQALLLAVAALLGKGVYNFGELLAHPILYSLKDSPKEWLIDVLGALNAGKCDKFQEFQPKLEAEAIDLKKNMPMLIEKLQLLCLMEMAMQLPPKERNLPFSRIAKETSLVHDRVELLVMKALANGLIQGHIDQVSQNVNITWVQPRVLSNEQIKALAQRMSKWRNDVNAVGAHMQTHANDVIVTYT